MYLIDFHNLLKIFYLTLFELFHNIIQFLQVHIQLLIVF